MTTRSVIWVSSSISPTARLDAVHGSDNQGMSQTAVVRDPELLRVREEQWREPGQGTIFDAVFRGAADVRCRQPFALRSGQPLDHWTIQTLAMAPTDSDVSARYLSNKKRFLIDVVHPDYIRSANRVAIEKDERGFYLYYDLVDFLSADRRGLGACAFYRSAQMAQRLGLHAIRCEGAGGKNYKIAPGEWEDREWQGYFAWGLFGFDAPLHEQTLKALAGDERFATCKSLLDVLSVDPVWWKEHGAGGDLTFDLAQGSRSWQTLEAYLSAKGFRI